MLKCLNAACGRSAGNQQPGCDKGFHMAIAGYKMVERPLCVFGHAEVAIIFSIEEDQSVARATECDPWAKRIPHDWFD